MSANGPLGSVGSPLKKQRASLSGVDEEDMRKRFGLGLVGVQADVLGAIKQEKVTNRNSDGPVAQDNFTFGGQLGTAAPEEEKAVKTEEMEEEL